MLIRQGHLCTQTQSHLGCLCARHTATQDHALAGFPPRYAPGPLSCQPRASRGPNPPGVSFDKPSPTMDVVVYVVETFSMFENFVRG